MCLCCPRTARDIPKLRGGQKRCVLLSVQDRTTVRPGEITRLKSKLASMDEVIAEHVR